MEPIIEIQQKLKAPKGQYNSFGKYRYRSCEDIIEALKPIIHPMGFWLKLSDKPIEIGGRIYIEATAILTNGEKIYDATASAREDESKKGMDGSQVTGAASSYARKYALNGLLAIDDSKDADSEKAEIKKPVLTPKSPEWVKAVDFVSKGGDIAAILRKYELINTDEDELRKHIS